MNVPFYGEGKGEDGENVSVQKSQICKQKDFP